MPSSPAQPTSLTMAALTASAYKAIPQFQSRDIDKTVRFYTQGLGFALNETREDEYTEQVRFCSLAMGKNEDVTLYFSKCTPGKFYPRSAMIGLGRKELDAYHALLKKQGEIDVADLEDTGFGFRQFSILDIDGNVLTFFRELN